VLEAARAVENVVTHGAAGWEPVVRIVFDGLLHADPFLEAAELVQKEAGGGTRLFLFSEFLDGVERRYDEMEAQAMVSVVPPQRTFAVRTELKPLTSLLVAAKRHPLGRGTRAFSSAEVERETYLTVKSSVQTSALSTAVLRPHTVFHLSDFHTKRQALLRGMGYGWMPRYLIEKDLKAGRLAVLKWEGESRHTFQPTIYSDEKRGRALALLLGALRRLA
jgi:DNA-binding transcriptional LysR family regulator